MGILEKLSRKEIEVEKILSTIKIRGVKKSWFIPAIFALPAMTVLGNLLYFLVGWKGQLRFIKPGPDGLGIFVLREPAV